MARLPHPDRQLDSIFEAFPDLLYVLNQDGVILDYKAGDPGMLFVSPDHLRGRKIQDVFPVEVGEKIAHTLSKCQRSENILLINYSLSLSGREHYFDAKFVPVSKSNIIMLARDVTSYKLFEIKVQSQLKQLAALRSIDQAINSGLDLNLILSMLLGHVVSQLCVDAADILMLERDSQILEFAAGVGFRAPTLKHTRLRLGEGLAGQVARERRMINVHDLNVRQTDFERSPTFSREGFVVYHAVPLIAKGQVFGVLETFHRSHFTPDSDWLNFLNTLGGQAAIAIDNSTMFRELQRSNAELKLAYDAIIEGWSRTLDLRDKETEGHTRRVTEITVNLASRMGLSDAAIMHIRRGAILHDIGKVAIPDQILFKPGPLTEDEWKVMRRHPSIAVELLSPISHLAPSLDIPRFHHEKWNGAGYPDGLEKQQIPLAARLFAVVDVYDALTSDRPYRSAWSRQEAVDYIKDQSGKHFDPEIVPRFLELFYNPNNSSLYQ